MKNSFLSLTITAFLASTSVADVAPTTQEVRAFVVPKETLSIRASLNGVNDSLDILEINDAADANDIYSAIGDSQGIDLGLTYGIHEHIDIHYNLENIDIDYAGSSINNIKNELYARVNFYDVPHYSFDDFSMDVGYIHNASDDLNAIMKDLSDDSLYLRLLLGSKFSSSLLTWYTGAKYTNINTSLYGTDSNRDEKTLLLGVSHTLEFSRFILDSNYEYLHIFGRAGNLTENKSNHIFTINLSRAISNQTLLFLGTKIMLHQFNGMIPYLYNTKTQSAFDKKYSYFKIGFVYNFDFLSPKERAACQKNYRPKAFSFFGL